MGKYIATLYRQEQKYINNAMKEYKLGSIVTMKKEHPCGTNEWEITRIGADIKIKCIKCGSTIMMPRIEFNRKLKKVLEY